MTLVLFYYKWRGRCVFLYILRAKNRKRGVLERDDHHSLVFFLFSCFFLPRALGEGFGKSELVRFFLFFFFFFGQVVERRCMMIWHEGENDTYWINRRNF